LTFVAGRVDAISFLGLGVLRSAVSLIAFVTGVFAASRMTGRVRTAQSWPAGFRTALGVEVVAQTAFLVGWLACSGRPGTALEAVLVGILALAMGMQSGAVGPLGLGEILATYMTGTMTGLLGETGHRDGLPARQGSAHACGGGAPRPRRLLGAASADRSPCRAGAALALTLRALAATVYLPASASDRDRSDGPP
jgi:uncharacterized protein DUF1275